MCSAFNQKFLVFPFLCVFEGRSLSSVSLVPSVFLHCIFLPFSLLPVIFWRLVAQVFSCFYFHFCVKKGSEILMQAKKNKGVYCFLFSHCQINLVSLTPCPMVSLIVLCWCCSWINIIMFLQVQNCKWPVTLLWCHSFAILKKKKLPMCSQIKIPHSLLLLEHFFSLIICKCEYIFLHLGLPFKH